MWPLRAALLEVMCRELRVKAEPRRSLGMVWEKLFCVYEEREKIKMEKDKVLFLDVGLSKKWVGSTT